MINKNKFQIKWEFYLSSNLLFYISFSILKNSSGTNMKKIIFGIAKMYIKQCKSKKGLIP